MSKEEPPKKTWKKGWATNATTVHQAPRWSVTLDGYNTSVVPVVNTSLKNVSFSVGGGFRKTWIQNSLGKYDNPGPGKYRTDTDHPLKKKDEFDVKKTIVERSPMFSLGKDAKESLLPKIKLSTLKPSYLNVPDTRSNVMKPTPGPGQYTQYTFFGGASGPTRKTYF
jgi:hypothetical protein